MTNVKQNKMYRYLIVLTISSTLGLEAWLTLFNNFAVEAVGLEGSHIGIIQSIREIPGFLTFLVVFVLLLLKEHRLAALSIVILGLGMAATGLFPSYSGLIFTTLIMSFGFHYSLGIREIEQPGIPHEYRRRHSDLLHGLAVEFHSNLSFDWMSNIGGRSVGAFPKPGRQ